MSDGSEAFGAQVTLNFRIRSVANRREGGFSVRVRMIGGDGVIGALGSTPSQVRKLAALHAALKSCTIRNSLLTLSTVVEK